jgi:hypothetical protein
MPLHLPLVTLEEYRVRIKQKIAVRGHDLQRHLNGVHLICIRCKFTSPKSNPISWEARECLGNFSLSEDPNVVLGTLPAIGPKCEFVGKLNEFHVLSRKIQAQNKASLSNNRSNLKKARNDLFLKTAWQFAGSVAKVEPAPSLGLKEDIYTHTSPWMLAVDSSHTLYVAGGLLFCSKCGTIASMPRKSRLHEICIPLPEYSPQNPSQKHGSLSRIAGLLGGSITSTHLSRWPNGADKRIRIKPLRFHPRAPQVVRNEDAPVSQDSEVARSRSIFPGGSSYSFSNQPFANNPGLAFWLANLSDNATVITEEDRADALEHGAS